MRHKRHKRHKKRFEYRFEIIVERDSVRHEVAAQSLRFERADRDILYYTGNLAQKNLYDQLLEDYAVELRQERRAKMKQGRFGP